ncbi:hypothetical protein H7100_00715 [Candidatus Saccharibacteria bacterium]|nr:hypothetical protein [Candidatus Saccharibacteria bacterium]
MPALVNPFPFVFIFATAFGVVMHDTQVDKATSVAIMTPASFTNVALANAVAKSNEHVHVERMSVSSQGSATHPEKVAKTQPRNDHTRYIQVKKHAHDGGDNGLWPSV